MDSHPEICFIIPAGCGEQLYLKECVRSAHQAAAVAGQQSYEVLVIFDGPASPELQDLVKGAGGRVLLLAEKRGPAVARNRGVETTTAPILFFIDADVVLEPDALKWALQAMNIEEINATDVEEANPEVYDGVMGAYTPHTPVAGVVSRLKNLQHSYVHRSHAGPIRSFWTACSALTRQAYSSVGGLDEHQRYCEDIALGIKMAKAGKKILLDPKISGTHMKHYTLASWLHSDLVGRAIPWSLMLLTGRAEMGQLNTGKGGIASLLAAITVAISPLLLLWQPAAAAGLLLAGLLVFTGLNRGFVAFVNRHASWAMGLAAIPFLLLHSAVALLGFGSALLMKFMGLKSAIRES